MKTIIGIIVVIIIIVGGWILLAPASTPAPVATTPTAPIDTTASTTVPVAAPVIGSNLALGTNNSTTLGLYLIGYNDKTVYTYDNDSVGTSTCYNTCATNWIPYAVSPSDDISNIQSGISGTTGTITRADGTLQLTYNGLPLYFYAGDMSNTDTNGNNLGKVWHIVKAS